MTGRFSEKVVLIAGGTGGLGQTVSLAFLNESARVIVTYTHQDGFLALQKAAGDRSSSLQGHRADVTSETECAQAVEKILAEEKRIDVLVNAVGAYAGGSPLWKTSADVLAKMMSINFQAGYALSHAVVPAMLKERRGSIVNVSSRAAVDHAAGAAAYAASKAAANAMFDSLAADLKGSGVRVNSILPSIIDTQANRSAMPSADFAQWPKPEDLAQVILFLSSDDAKVVHGASVPVYGQT